jgi:hypothetical protein
MVLDNYFANEFVQVGGLISATQDPVVAAGNNQATATPLGSAQMVRVGTTAASTGVLLPPSQAGAEIVILNSGANSLSVYPSGTETINALAGGAAFAMAAGALNIFYCFTAGKWFTK